MARRTMAATTFNGPNVSFKNEAFRKMEGAYTVIRDCLAGERAIKTKTTAYLPALNTEGDSDTNGERYKGYIGRAVFYAVAQRTLSGMLGLVFMRDPVVEVPPEIAFILQDANGDGMTLDQLAQAAVACNIAFARGGLWVDHPPAPAEGISKQQREDGDLRATIHLYKPWEIINWRTTQRGGRNVLSLVVIEEEYDREKNAFETEKAKRWRVLSLNEAGQYQVQKYNLDNRTFVEDGEAIVPKDNDGQPFNEIPFMFFGIDGNVAEVSYPAMYDICSLNIAHYRNSADYEDSVFLIGQPTPVLTGLTEDWVKRVLKGRVMLGARYSISLPVGADAKLMQAEPNTLAAGAMEQKELQMAALGARLLEVKNVIRTATEVNVDDKQANSTLQTATRNVSAVFKAALAIVCRFHGVKPIMDGDKQLAYDLNTEFDLVHLSPDDRRQLVEEWQKGAIAWEELRASLRRGGVAYLKDDVAQPKIDKEQKKLAELEAAKKPKPAAPAAVGTRPNPAPAPAPAK